MGILFSYLEVCSNLSTWQLSGRIIAAKYSIKSTSPSSSGWVCYLRKSYSYFPSDCSCLLSSPIYGGGRIAGHFIIQHVDDDGNGGMMRYSPSSIEGSPTQATRLNRKIFAQTCSNVFRRNIYCRDWLTIVETECCWWGVTNEMGPVRRKIRPYFSIIKCLISSYVRGISGIKKLSTC